MILANSVILAPRRAKALSTLIQAKVSSAKHGYKLTTVPVESFGRLANIGKEFVDQLAIREVGGDVYKNLRRKGGS